MNYLSEIFAWVQTIGLQIAASSCADCPKKKKYSAFSLVQDERNPNITPFWESAHPWPTRPALHNAFMRSVKSSKQAGNRATNGSNTHSLKQASASRDVPVTSHVLYRTIILRCCACLVKDTCFHNYTHVSLGRP